MNEKILIKYICSLSFMRATFTAPNVLEHTRVNTDSKLLGAPSDITKTNEMKVSNLKM